MATEHNNLWESDAEARVLEARLNGFWNPDYFQHILVPKLNLKDGDKVLDVGAGNGALTLLLARYFPAVHFTGIDITPSMIADADTQARRLGIQNAEFVEGNALQLQFEDNSFDAVVCQTLLMHLGDPEAAVNEMSRILKKGGRFMAAEYHILSYEKPIETAQFIDDGDEARISSYMQLIIRGYRLSGQGNFKMGGRVPFLATNAGLNISDIRINDRLPFAFPPYRKPSEKISLTELQGWEALIKDPAYRSWLAQAMIEGGGNEADADSFLKLLPSYTADIFKEESRFAFVWLLNPILLITVAEKI